jgi:uncharacterized metal-binding protein
VLWKATKTGRSGLVFGDAQLKCHHHLGNPILLNMDQRRCDVSMCSRMEMSCSVNEKNSASLSVICPVPKTQRSRLVFADAPSKGHHHLGNPILQNMDQRHCNVSMCSRMEMSCSVAEKNSASLSVICPATKTQRSRLVFADAPPKGHHHLGNPILQNMDQRHCNVRLCFRTQMSCSVAERSSTAALLGALESNKNWKILTGL